MGCHFIGGTLWTDYVFSGAEIDYNSPTGEKIETLLADGRKRPFSKNDSMNLHEETRKMIEKCVMEYDEKRPLIVVTHHAPLFECLPEKAKKHVLGWQLCV